MHLERTASALEHGLDRDGRAEQLRREWHALEDRARALAWIPFYQEGYGGLLGRMERLADEG